MIQEKFFYNISKNKKKTFKKNHTYNIITILINNYLDKIQKQILQRCGLMKISIIIPTYNEEEFLPNLLTSIQRQGFDDMEVIIADAHSADKTVDIAESFGCKVVPGGLPATGRNNGAAVAESQLLLFLDADSVLTNNYISSAIEEFELHNLGIAITQIVPLEKGFINQISHELANYLTKQISHIKPHGAGCYGILTYK